MNVCIMSNKGRVVLSANGDETLREVLDRSGVDYKPHRFYNPALARAADMEEDGGWLTERYNISVAPSGKALRHGDLEAALCEYACVDDLGAFGDLMIHVMPIAFNVCFRRCLAPSEYGIRD